jgi:DNA invertase Pin-like site-specific DNA recombinase
MASSPTTSRIKELTLRLGTASGVPGRLQGRRLRLAQTPPELDACLDYLRARDTLVVWRLDRLGRGLKHLIDALEQLHAREIGFRSVTEQIDTTTSGGMLQFHIFGALAEFERHIIRERTRAGLAAARARGRLGGRPPVLTAEKLDAARMMREQKRTMPEIARALGVSRATLYRHLALEQTPGEQAA